MKIQTAGATGLIRSGCDIKCVGIKLALGTNPAGTARRLSAPILAFLVSMILIVTSMPGLALAAGPDFQIKDLTGVCCSGSGTTYTVHYSGGSNLQFSWTASLECGTFTPQGSSAFWAHPDPQLCETTVHQGTVSVTVSDATGSITCTDPGGSEGPPIPGSSCTSGIYSQGTSEFLLEASANLNATSGPIGHNFILHGAHGEDAGSINLLPGHINLIFQTNSISAISPLSGQSYISTTVTGFNFATQGSQGSLIFTLNGNPGTQGLFKVFIPNSFMPQPVTVTMDGSQVNPSYVTNSSGYVVDVENFHYSQHSLQISGTLSSGQSATGSQTQTSQSTTQSSASGGGGGIPEFPFQILATIAFTIFVVMSYVVVRRHTSHGPSE